jgi:hypothetical protein
MSGTNCAQSTWTIVPTSGSSMNTAPIVATTTTHRGTLAYPPELFMRARRTYRYGLPKPAFARTAWAFAARMKVTNAWATFWFFDSLRTEIG